ncbi:MAG: phenylalanine--tRNA ligase subunit beta [Candidatus Pacearchaeota archaeon]|nr:phenylalanine--tRNA ligase subunit beta [Candidatus Pacearchaeota archaeon]
MAIVKFSRKEFEKHIKLTKQVEEKISMFGTPLESVNENEVEIEVFPNRPDLLSLQGFVRAFLAFTGRKKGLRKYKLNKPERNYEVTVDGSVKDVRPFTACAIVKNLKFTDEKIKEVIDIQEKIHSTLGRDRKKVAIGIYPLDKIFLPIRYKAERPENIRFIPLGEKNVMSGQEILDKTPTGKQYSHLLKGMKKFPVFLDVAGNVMSMPPIINSEQTGKITESTREIFIECSGFEFNVLKKTLNILVTMFADLGGEVYQMRINYGWGKQEITPDLAPEKLKINIDNINKLLGIKLKEKDIKTLLERMGYDYNNNEVSVPAWRTDVLHEVDIAEDIAIAYGYDNFEPEIPEIATVGGESRKETLRRKVAEILSGLGFLEIISYYLLTKEDVKKFGAGHGSRKELEVERSKTDYNTLRSNLICPVLKILGRNTDAEYPQRIFEIGEVFEKNEKLETGVGQKDKLAVAITPGNFTDIKQVLDYLGEMLDKKIEVSEKKEQGFIEGRTARILVEGIEAGVIGEIHPSVLKAWHLKMPLACMELDFEKLIS